MQDYPERKRLAVYYVQLLREMKRSGLKIEDVPDDLQASMLALHQNALLVWWEERKN